MATAFAIYFICIFGAAAVANIVRGIQDGVDAFSFILNGIGLAGGIYLLMLL